MRPRIKITPPRPSAAAKAPLAVAQGDSAHPSSITPKRSKRIAVTTVETSSEPPQPSLLEKKMNMTVRWSGVSANNACVTGEARP